MQTFPLMRLGGALIFSVSWFWLIQHSPYTRLRGHVLMTPHYTLARISLALRFFMALLFR
jgi:hypothetical protein